jgi:hypothetical protein
LPNLLLQTLSTSNFSLLRVISRISISNSIYGSLPSPRLLLLTSARDSTSPLLSTLSHLTLLQQHFSSIITTPPSSPFPFLVLKVSSHDDLVVLSPSFRNTPHFEEGTFRVSPHTPSLRIRRAQSSNIDHNTKGMHSSYTPLTPPHLTRPSSLPRISPPSIVPFIYFSFLFIYSSHNLPTISPHILFQFDLDHHTTHLQSVLTFSSSSFRIIVTQQEHHHRGYTLFWRPSPTSPHSPLQYVSEDHHLSRQRGYADTLGSLSN